MKTFNTQLIVPFIITLLLTGCMPDSLTKFKKEEPTKKAAPVTNTTNVPAGPVVDESGVQITFDAPTYFSWGTPASPARSVAVGGGAIKVEAVLDGSLGDDAKTEKFFLSCTLITTGVHALSTALPAGITLSSSECAFIGNPTAFKSVSVPVSPGVATGFCSDLTSATQSVCEANPLVWNAGTSTCSLPDLKYATMAQCNPVPGTPTVFHKWYPLGAPVPYRVRINYKDADGLTHSAYSTFELGTYKAITSLKYNQADKLLLKIDPASAGIVSSLGAIVPAKTTSSLIAPSSATASAYANANIISAQNGAQGIANFVDSTQKMIGVRKLVKMTLNNATAFSAGGYISTAANAKIGKIFKKDTSNPNILYVENVSPGEVYFAVGDQLDNQFAAPFNAVETVSAVPVAITAIDDTAVFDSMSPNMDNDRSYYGNKIPLLGTVKPSNSYVVNSPTDIKPLKPLVLDANNGTVFSVSPKLPSGLTLNTQTGAITGKFLKTSPDSMYTVTATNPVNSVSASFNIVASNAPTDLTLSTKQIITVSSTFFFNEGETLYQDIQPPLVSSSTGKITKIFANGNQMAVDVKEGSFLAGASLDSGSAFYSEKAYVIPDNSCVDNNYNNQIDCEAHSSVWSVGPIYYNLGLKLSAGNTAFTTGSCSDPAFTTQVTCDESRAIWDDDSSTCSDPSYTTQVSCEEPNGQWGVSYVTASAGFGNGARAIISGIYRDPSNDILFVRQLTGTASGTASALTFYQGDTVATGVTISELDHSFSKLYLASVASFSSGGDVTSATTPGDVIQAGGYIYRVDSPFVYLSDLTKASGMTSFKVGDLAWNDEYRSNVGAVSSAINRVTHDVHLVAEKGKAFSVNTSVSLPNVTFSITPTLPAGMTLDSSTGKISGMPTAITPSKDFLLKATNFTGETTYVFSLEVRDYLTLAVTTDSSSFVMHKAGDTQADRPCRVNASDILNGKVPDIRCILDGEEQDVYYNDVKLKALASAGICQYVTYTPFAFWRFKPTQTAGTTVAGSYPVASAVETGCQTAGSVPTPDLCEGNYTDPDTNAKVYCDEGYLNYTIETFALDGSNVCTSTGPAQTRTVACGGKKTNCINGPVRDILSDAQIEGGFTGKISSTSTGVNTEWMIKSPFNKGFASNLYSANSTSSNQCNLSSANANTWVAAASTKTNVGNTGSPWGKSRPFYTVECLNAASQVKARFRMVIREWDRKFNISDALDGVHPLDHGSYSFVDKMNSIATDTLDGPFNNINDWDNEYRSPRGACSDPAFESEEDCYRNSEAWTPTNAAYAGTCGAVGAGREYKFPGFSL